MGNRRKTMVTTASRVADMRSAVHAEWKGERVVVYAEPWQVEFAVTGKGLRVASKWNHNNSRLRGIEDVLWGKIWREALRLHASARMDARLQ